MFKNIKLKIKEWLTPRALNDIATEFNWSHYTDDMLLQIVAHGTSPAYSTYKNILFEKRNSLAKSIVINAETSYGKNDSHCMKAYGTYLAYAEILELPRQAGLELERRGKLKKQS